MTTPNCYFHFDRHRPAVAIVNNRQFDMPVCLECLDMAMGRGYAFVSEIPQEDVKPAEPQVTDYTDGQWIAMTVGQFCQILIDSGEKEAILFRVMQPDQRVDDKSFVRQYHVIQAPSGVVQEHINALEAATHKVLAGFLERGLIT